MSQMSNLVFYPTVLKFSFSLCYSNKWFTLGKLHKKAALNCNFRHEYDIRNVQFLFDYVSLSFHLKEHQKIVIQPDFWKQIIIYRNVKFYRV